MSEHPRADTSRPGEERATSGTARPLEGIRVPELASIVAGPFCGALLAEFGAEVIKTEIPGRGDDLRRLGPTEGQCAYWWAVDNRNKRVMTLDLHTPRAQAIVRQLVPRVDVVIENFRPGVLMSMADIFADPHYRERQMIIDVPDPAVGRRPPPAVVPKLWLTPGRVTHAGPPVGHHTAAILGELFAMSPDDIAALRREGVI